MINKKSQICSCCGSNSGGLAFVITNENDKEILVAMCWDCLAEKARAIAQEKRADKENIIDGGDSE